MVRSSLLVPVLFFALGVPAVLAQDAGSPLIGRVIAAEHGAPLPRVRIAAVIDDRPTDPLLTDDYGWFAIDARSGASISFVASKAGYAARRRVVTPAERSRIAPLEIRLGRAGAITGRVVDTSGVAALGTEVTAQRIGVAADTASRFSTAADDRGEYRLGGLPPGRYEVTAATAPPPTFRAVAFIRAMSSRGAPESTGGDSAPGAARSPFVVETQPGAEVGRIDFVVASAPNPSSRGETVRPLGPTATGGLSGTIVDEFGDPLEGVDVEALRVIVVDGRAVMPFADVARRTDDRGQYRIFGLQPGSYLVRVSTDATVPGGVRRGDQGFAPIYYPGLASVAWATPVAVRAGREEGSVDAVFSPSLAVRVSGRAVAEDGQPLAGAIKIVAILREWGIALDPPAVPLGADGTFAIANVPPGDYAVQAFGASGAGRPATFGVGYVSVFDRDPPPLTVNVTPGATLEGRILVEGQPNAGLRSTPASTSTISLRALPADPDWAPALGRGQGLVLSSTGAFYVTGLHGPVQFALNDDFAGWYIKAMTIGGSDVTRMTFDAGLSTATVTGAEIVIGRASSVIEGRITNASVRAEAKPFVLLFAAESLTGQGHRVAALAAPALDGSFRVSRVPPGSYFVTAITAAEASSDWRSPATLGRFAQRGMRVAVGEDDRLTIDLRLGAR